MTQDEKDEAARRASAANARAQLAGAPVAVRGGRPEELPTKALLSRVAQDATQLIKAEVELAKTELKADLKSEVAMAKGLTVAGLCALFTVNLMLVAIALALGHVMPDWAAALLVAAVVLAIGTVAGLVGWKKRVKDPLATTRRTLKEDLRWAKERIA